MDIYGDTNHRFGPKNFKSCSRVKNDDRSSASNLCCGVDGNVSIEILHKSHQICIISKSFSPKIGEEEKEVREIQGDNRYYAISSEIG